jgi:hypothetical protein
MERLGLNQQKTFKKKVDTPRFTNEGSTLMKGEKLCLHLARE